MKAIGMLAVLALVVGKIKGRQSWKEGDIETLVEKDKSPLEKAYGAVTTLRKLANKTAVTPAVYEAEMAKQRKLLSAFVDFEIRSEIEVDEVLEFWVTTNKSISFASRASGLFTFTNVLLIFAIVVGVTPFVSAFVIYCGPLLISMPPKVQVPLAYLASVVVLAVALFACGPAIQHYVATIGAIALAASYGFNLFLCRHRGLPPYAMLILPVFLVLGALAVIFQTRLIGFLTIFAYEAMLGFFIYTGPLYTIIGFTSDSVIPIGICGSGTLLAFYLVNALGLIPFISAIASAVEVFEMAVLTCGTFVTFAGLLILSSRHYYRDKHNSFVIYNTLAVTLGMLSFFLGSLTPSLGLFRGVASTFFVIFLMHKYSEIPWGNTWSLGLLGGSLLLIALCFFIKSHPHLFAFY